MKRVFPYIAIFVVGAVLFVIFAQTLRSEGGAKLAPLVDDVDIAFFSTIFTYLLFAAVVVERFLEMIVSQDRERLKLPFKRALEIAQEQVDANPTDKEARRELRKARKELAEFREDTRKLTLRYGFVIGLALAIVGVGIFRPLFDTSEYPDWQLGLFWAVDCILTAGVISGGSSGISKMNDSLGKALRGDGNKNAPTASAKS